MKKACRWQSLIVVVLATLAHAQDFLPYQTIVSPTNDTRRFGRRVAVSGTSLAITEVHLAITEVHEQPERVFVYEKNETTSTFEQNTILTNPNTRLFATYYGISLNLQNGILVVGDEADRYGLRGGLGAVFVYRQNPGSRGTSSSYELLQTLRAENGRPGDYYGSRVALSNDGLTIAVGVHNADLKQGAIYVYTWNDSTGLFGAEQKVVTHEWRRPTLLDWWLDRRPKPLIGLYPPNDVGLGYTLAVQNGLLVAAQSKGPDKRLFAFERSAADGLFRERSPGPLEECGGACNITYFYGKVVLADSNEVVLRNTRGRSVYASLGPPPFKRLQKVGDKGTYIATGGGYLVICSTGFVHECNVFRKNVQTALWETSGTLVLALDGDCQMDVWSLAMDEEKTVVVGTYCRSDALHDVVVVYELP